MSEPNKKSPPPLYLPNGKEAKSELIEVTPGQWIASHVHPDDVPRIGLVRLMRQADGSYIPVLKAQSQLVRMTRDLGENVGLHGLSWKSLYRLIGSGFVQSSRPTPNVILVDLASLFAHVEAARDPEFWTPQRRAIWSQAVAEFQ
jgi:hypothetical protein